MRKKARIFLLIIICFIVITTNSCWDYKEIADEIIVAGAAIDYDIENDGILLTIEVILPVVGADKDSNLKSLIYQCSGKNMVDASKNIVTKVGHHLLWSHNKIIIFSKKLMERENLFNGTMDWIKRARATRPNMWLLLSEEETAGEIFLESVPQTEKIVSTYLDQLFLTSKDNYNYIRTPFWRYMEDINSPSASATLPTIEINKSNTGNIPLLYGTELIRKNKPEGRLNAEQTKIYLLIMNRLQNANFIFQHPNNKAAQNVTLKIFNNKAEITPIVSAGELKMKVKVESEAIVQEIDGEQRIFTQNNIMELQKEAEKSIIEEINNLISLCQKQYGVDIFGLGNKVEYKYAKFWKGVKNDWISEFVKAVPEIQLDLKITGSDQSMEVPEEGE